MTVATLHRIFRILSTAGLCLVYEAPTPDPTSAADDPRRAESQGDEPAQ